MTPRASWTKKPALWALLLWCVSGAAYAQLQTFPANSLIIPMQANFQTPCGIFSAYGLVWRILKENGPTGYFGSRGKPVIIYEIINPSKRSHNRCTPTSANTPPSGNPAWQDGCDFTISSNGPPYLLEPVAQVPAGAPPLPMGGQFATPTSSGPPLNFFPQTSNLMAKPNYLMPSTLTAPGFHSISYLGAPFVIDGSDTPNVIAWLNTTTDPNIQQFTVQNSTEDGQCNNFSTIQNFAPGPPSTNSQITEIYHYVSIHQATVAFKAPVARRLNQIPPKIALVRGLDSLGSNGTVQSFLDEYLKQAGLFFTGTMGFADSAGCPVGSLEPTCNLNGSTPGSKHPGLIYDAFFANADFVSTTAAPNGLINQTGPDGGLAYPVLWAPHWELATPADGGHVPGYTGGATPVMDNVMANLAIYSANPGTGLLAECASIESYEDRSNTPIRFISDAGVVSNGDGITIPGGGYDLQNCSDPDYTSGTCGTFANFSNPFGQIGDFRYYENAGFTEHFQPNNGLLGSPRAFSLISTAGSTSQAEMVDFGYYQGDNTKASVVYLSGHDYSGLYALANPTAGDASKKALKPGGIRIALNTLINLGYQEVSAERALSAPVGFFDQNAGPDGGLPVVISGTYQAVQSAPPGAASYLNISDGSGGRGWLFPFNEGHLRAHPLSGPGALAAGESDFAAASLWDADAKMPLPGQRNLFTYLGGQFTANPATNGVIQSGWLAESIEGTHLTPPCSAPTSCVNTVKYGLGTSGQSFDILPGADQLCDLQQVMNFTFLPRPPSDFANICLHIPTFPLNRDAMAQDFVAVQEMLQRIRGFCYAADASGTVILAPTDSQCDSSGLQVDNRAHLGGIVHSTPAIVTPTPNIPATPDRPTVAYVGALDGQLHAIYVSGGVGYTGPLTPITLPNPAANTKFANDYSITAFPSGVPPGTELWSFMPATQLQLAFSNSGKVDSSPAVQDVFADFTGTGKREWHTVLVASVGKDGSEVFAMDVTNPLKPSLLWDIHGVFTAAGEASGAGGFSPIPLADGSNSGSGLGASVGVRWDQESTNFIFGSPFGNQNDVPYDYRALGGASDVSIGQMRSGLAPIYSAFVATNYGGGAGSGLEVYAIDIVTGQKLWQWQELYGRPPFPTIPPFVGQNGFPPPPSLLQTDNGVERVYVGDMQGRVWELNALTGQNWNTFPNAGCVPVPGTTYCSAPAFDVGSQIGWQEPISTNIAIAVVPSTVNPSSAFVGLEGARVLAFGTGGEDWVSNTNGSMNFVPIEPQFRVPLTIGGYPQTILTKLFTSQASDEAFAVGHASTTPPPTHGALLEPAGNFPIQYPFERAYGSVVVSGQTVFFQTAVNVGSDINLVSATLGGHAYTVDLGTALPVSPASGLTGAGVFASSGPAVLHIVNGSTSTDWVVSNEVGKINATQISNASTTGHASPTQLLGLAKNGVLWSLRAWINRIFQ